MNLGQKDKGTGFHLEGGLPFKRNGAPRGWRTHCTGASIRGHRRGKSGSRGTDSLPPADSMAQNQRREAPCDGLEKRENRISAPGPQEQVEGQVVERGPDLYHKGTGRETETHSSLRRRGQKSMSDP